MKITSTILMFFLFSQSALARTGSKLKCFDLAGGIEIVSKLDKHHYEADVWNWGMPRSRVIIQTNSTEFNSEGVVTMNHHFWINSLDKPELKLVKLSNGFSKKVMILKESDACDKHEAPLISKRVKAENALRAETEKLALKESAARMAQRDKEKQEEKAEKAAHNQAIKDGKEPEYLEAQEIKADEAREKEKEEEEKNYQTQKAVDDELKRISDIESDKNSAIMKQWFRLSPEKRRENCEKVRVKGDSPCEKFPTSTNQAELDEMIKQQEAADKSSATQ